MRDRYRHELERLGPRQEELDRLYDMIEEGTEMKIGRASCRERVCEYV